MRSKSGSDLRITEEIRREIAGYGAHMCTIEDVRKLSLEKHIIAVGDVTALSLNDAGIPLLLEVVDLKTKRTDDGTFRHLAGSIPVANPAATLTRELFSIIETCLREGIPRRIEIVGEEDLAVIPIIFYSDLNTVVVYGVPDKGMACIEVDGNTKYYVENLIKRMEEE